MDQQTGLRFFALPLWRRSVLACGLVLATAAFGLAQAAEAVNTQAAAAEATEVFVVPLPQQQPWRVYEGRVEAVRQTQLAAQVAGTLVELKAQAGDAVRAGQLLARIDARSVRQGVAANEAQLRAAQAALELANSELARQQRLFEQRFISQAALEHARAEHRAARARVQAQQAQVDAASTQADFHAIHAPYDGVLAAVTVELGDMLLPGRSLFELYDPAALRVSANLPPSVASGLAVESVRVALSEAAAQAEIQPLRVQVLPTVDAVSLTREVRADLPPDTAQAVPGMFARLRVKTAAAAAGQSPWVPLHLLVRRAEMTGLYVLDGQQRPLLRQVRAGQQSGDEIEILSGLAVGDRVVPAPRLPQQ